MENGEWRMENGEWSSRGGYDWKGIVSLKVKLGDWEAEFFYQHYTKQRFA
jgi:hypothetical protein